MTHHGLDTDKIVCFYEPEFYPLSNFSAFAVLWEEVGIRTKFDTSEALYHWCKFPDYRGVRDEIRAAPSAHEAFQIAQRLFAIWLNMGLREALLSAPSPEIPS